MGLEMGSISMLALRGRARCSDEGGRVEAGGRGGEERERGGREEGGREGERERGREEGGREGGREGVREGGRTEGRNERERENMYD